jgi:hypothetical protein
VLYADPEFIVKLKAKEKEKLGKTWAQPELKEPSVTPTPEISASREPRRLNQGLPSVPKAEPPPPITKLNINEIFQNYLELKRQQREFIQKLSEMENIFHQICEQNKTDQIETGIGTLKRIKTGTEYRWVVDL